MCLYKDKIYLFELHVIFEATPFTKVKHPGFWHHRQRMTKTAYKRGITETVAGVQTLIKLKTSGKAWM